MKEILLVHDQQESATPRKSFLEVSGYGVALAAIVLVTALDILQRIFGTTGLTFTQWCVCTGIALSIVVVEELIKLVIRRQGSPDEATPRTGLATAVPA